MITTVILRLTITFILALIFGYDRQKSHKPIGFGTYVFVTMGACGLALTAISIAPENPLPLLSAIVTGIGFLGAGALIKTGDRIFGFTSASSIWAFAIFGLLIGLGQYLIALTLYTSIWGVILFDKNLEKRGAGSHQTKISITTNAIIDEKEIRQILMLNTKKQKIMSTEVDKKNNTLSITYLIEGRKEDLNKLPKKLFEKPWFHSYKTYL